MLFRSVKKTVIATGGSVVYGEEAMHHLKDIALIVYLSLPLEELKTRLGNINDRGVVLRPGQTLEDIYIERTNSGVVLIYDDLIPTFSRQILYYLTIHYLHLDDLEHCVIQLTLVINTEVLRLPLEVSLL